MSPRSKQSDKWPATIDVPASLASPTTRHPSLPPPVNDCWITIGVNGNGTCRELQKFIHCRNCPVYCAAGLQLLDRELPADYRREQTLHYAEPKRLTQPVRISVIIFRLGTEWFALPTTTLQEVAERRFLHTVPHRRHSLVLGLVNVRGELMICASLARLLGLEQTMPYVVTDRSESRVARNPTVPRFDRMLVTQWDGQRLVFPVDEVHGIHRLQRDEMKAPPAMISKSTLTHTQGIFPWRTPPPHYSAFASGDGAATPASSTTPQSRFEVESSCPGTRVAEEREYSVGFLNPDSVFATLNRDLS